MREDENKRPSQDSGFKRFLKKRWAFPAIYISSAALILTGVLWYQNSSTDNSIDSNKFGYNASDVPGKDFREPAVEVNRSLENVVLPLSGENRDKVVIQKKFYDDNASAEEQEAALVVYKNQYHPNTGIDITVKDSEGFDVTASLSGTVTKVEEDALLGNVIEIEHDNNIVTQYQSVKDIKVKVGDEVEQGQALATAGQSLLNEEAGVHVHFEIRKNGVPVNPESYLNKPLSALDDADVTNEKEATEGNENSAEEDKATDENKSSKEDKAAEEKKSSDETDENGVSEEEAAENEEDATTAEPGSNDSDSQTDEESEKNTPSDNGTEEDNTDQKPDEKTNTSKNKDA